MFFRRRHPPAESDADRWRAFAERLELRDAGDVAERIRRWLDLDDAELRPVYLLQRPDLPAVYVYDVHTLRRGPTGELRRTRRCCLVRAEDALSAVAFRAWPRQNKVLDSLEASRSGAQRLELDDDPEFDAAVSVFARDAEGAVRALGGGVREVLARLLTLRGAGEPRVVVGERHLLVSFDAAEGDDMELAEAVLADTLALAALLPARAGPAMPVVTAPLVEISPDDLLDLP
jgi:hypothetical protein